MLDLEKLRQLREQAGLSQGQAAERAGLTNHQQWSRIESGAVANVRLDTLGKIAAALNVDPRDLIKPPPPRKKKPPAG